MILKKHLIITFIISAGVAFGVFWFAPVSRTLYIKNSASYLASADANHETDQINSEIGDLSKTLIPSIKIPKNLTEGLAETLAQKIISENTEPKTGKFLPGPGLNMPDPNTLAEDFIKNGLKKANENILNIDPPKLQISADNSKEATEKYLTEIQKIIKNNLNGESLISILEEINKNNGQNVGRLLPIITAHEITANQIEERPVPSNLKILISEEIRLLRITANVLKPLTNIENDPLAALAATQQFGVIIQSWANLQNKFNTFIQKLNQMQ